MNYKVLGPDRRPYHGGSGQWPVPGVRRSVEGPLVACEHGLHLCREQDLVRWLGPEIWEAAYEGELLECDDKIVVRTAWLVRRVDAWTERTARLFAADCAERVLPLYEAVRPTDSRPRAAIEAARQFARGEIDAAAGDASWDAAWAVAGDAARAAARAAAWAAAWAVAGDAARAVAGDAARAAARAAASAAAWAAARDAAGAWQTERLLQYLRGEIA